MKRVRSLAFPNSFFTFTISKAINDITDIMTFPFLELDQSRVNIWDGLQILPKCFRRSNEHGPCGPLVVARWVLGGTYNT